MSRSDQTNMKRQGWITLGGALILPCKYHAE
jgi:hypothetical protein